MPHPRPARPAPDPEDDGSPEELEALRAELRDRMAHHQAAVARLLAHRAAGTDPWRSPPPPAA
ncbi:hypothetical protein [Brevundimonas poindexterae]|uniref:hypothetical protein n=1 Tax=Brevundimonas poindexterae TaxID=74325 RepID=UPI001CFC9813|nr:hypothetical protein [Brevundimonas poindexterae]